MMATDIRIRAISRKSNDDGGGGGGECISLTRQSERSWLIVSQNRQLYI